jgi:hypothetical protein
MASIKKSDLPQGGNMHAIHNEVIKNTHLSSNMHMENEQKSSEIFWRRKLIQSAMNIPSPVVEKIKALARVEWVRMFVPDKANPQATG